jgi:DNA-binding CsgD family transcriptional regulator
MGKSGRVRLSDLRQAYRLIHDCRDVGQDPAAWPRVMAEGLARLVDARIAVVCEMRFEQAASASPLVVMADCGWESFAVRADWFKRHCVELEFWRFPSFQNFAALGGGLVTRTREQLVADSPWYRSDEFHGTNRTYGVDDMLASHLRLDDQRVQQGFQVFRDLARERFGARERRLVRIFHRELLSHLGRTLVRTPGEAVARLPRRLRQTLDCLVAGDSEKQVALRLGLSRHTVHAYIKALHRRLGVSSRAELLALYFRRHR